MRYAMKSDRYVVWMLAAAALSWLAAIASAAEPLRWKLKVGDKLNYHTTQDMTMRIDAGAAGQMVTTFHQTVDMTWNVERLTEDGSAVIEQSIDRVTMSMTAPKGPAFEYDSDAEGPAVGMAAMIAPMFDAMTEGKFEITMTPRGEVRDIKLPQNVLDALKYSPGAAVMGDMATAEGLQQMLMQRAIVLPEESPVQGESWPNTATLNNPMVGKQTVETSYRYEGMKDVDGVNLAVFRPSIKMEFEGDQMAQMKITEQQSDGEVLFNQEAGRLDSMALHQMTKMDVTIAGQTFQQQIDQLIEIHISPAEEGPTGTTNE